MGSSAPPQLGKPKQRPAVPQHAGHHRRPRKRAALVVVMFVVLTVGTGLTMVSAGAIGLGGGRSPASSLGRALLFMRANHDRAGSKPAATDAGANPAPTTTAPAIAAPAAADPTTAALAGSADTPSLTGLKAASSGLILTRPNALSLYPFIDDMTIQSVDWAQLEPRPGAYDFSAVDQVLRSHPNAKARLRIYAGFRAPRWLDGVSGPCVPISGGVSGISGCTPRFWTDAYLGRYARFTQALAAHYDPNPQVVGVINAACSTVFAEPFILGIGSDRASAQRLAAAGLSEASHRHCIEQSTASMDTAFRRTRIVLDGHTKWQIVTPDGGRADSWAKERDLLNGLRGRYGGKLVVEDHGLGPTDMCSPGQPLSSASSWYCWLASLPAPKGFQFSLRGGSMSAATANGLQMNACFLEFAGFTQIAAQQVDTRLSANPGC
jgi:hypothetical protein